ncbi:MAG: hypothetical protein ACE5HT_09905 [Gemmatimonadales bacterium]
MKKFINFSLIAAVGIAAGACSDSGGTGPTTGPLSKQVSLSFSSAAPSAAPAPAFSRFPVAALSDTLADGANTLILDSVQVVLKKIELKRVESVDCATDDCEEFEFGPIVVDVPLNGGTMQEIAVPIDTGTYDELEFKIHKVSGNDPEDLAFAAAHPDLVGKSIVAFGTYNGQAFAYETDLDQEQETELNPPLMITDSTTTTNVTVRLDVSLWFVDGAGNLIDPATANKGGANENVVKDNIKNSIKAFEDEDRDGDEKDEDGDNSN